jgi:protein-S-isoprenylcysteine O-methyltransferase Ste14
MEAKEKNITPRVIIQLLLFIVVMPLLPLLISWQWDWWEAWVYALICVLGFVISRVLALRRNPDLLGERAHSLEHEDTKAWDKKLAPISAFGGILLVVVAGLDALFGWTAAFSMPVKIAALVVMVGGYAWSSYALVENRFFSGVVRIQKERDHQVVSSGPYAVMRHPGYFGALLVYLATPLFLDSAWIFLPAILLVAVLVIRTSLEDKTLQEELEGYREYAQRVRYRLLPGVW